MMQNYRPFTGITPAVKILLILNIVMYFLSMFIDSRMHVDTAHLLGLHLPQSVFWRPWQYVTHMFMHGSFGHLFFNMFALFMFGRILESVWGTPRFLIFFFVMFFQMLWSTYLVFAGAQELRQAGTLLWTFRLPWHWAYYGTLFSPGVAQFAFGFYSVMLTSTVLGLVTMVLFKPRSWCVYCPMGTMTQLICRGKHRGEAALHSPAEGS